MDLRSLDNRLSIFPPDAMAARCPFRFPGKIKSLLKSGLLLCAALGAQAALAECSRAIVVPVSPTGTE
jgi:hypothetical protein